MSAAQIGGGQAVERMIRRRRVFLTVVTIGYLLWQGGYILSALELRASTAAANAIDVVCAVGFTVWLLSLLLLFFDVGFVAGNPALREAMNDELTQANRSAAFVAGFWVVMIVTVVVYTIGLFTPLTAAQAMPIIMAAGVTAPIVRFIMLEKRGESDG